ncbi:hypothetical protein NL108_011222 [Boleophthalmus pectinirostris]|nr:hypothetical protein NL108_011222 [Boleophthalmus pectinirostris]
MRAHVAVSVVGLYLVLSISEYSTVPAMRSRCFPNGSKQSSLGCITVMENEEDFGLTNGSTSASVQNNKTEEIHLSETTEVLQANGTTTEQATALPQTRAKPAPARIVLSQE